MKAIITAKFEIDVTDWYEGEKMTNTQKRAKLEEELSDFSVFMPLAQYKNFKDVEITFIP